LDFENSWILIRASGTEPKIRVIVESEGRGKLERLMSIGKQVVNIAKSEVL
jgi:phosphomannomutase